MFDDAAMASNLAYGHYYQEADAYPQQRQDGAFLDDRQRGCEDLEQPCSQFEAMAAPSSSALISSENLLDSNSLLYNQQGILVNPNVRRYHPSMINLPSSSQAHYQLEAQRLLGSLDLFRINVATLLNLKHLILPLDFPPHIDSIRADLFSQQMSSSKFNSIDMLDHFRQKSISAYVGEVPTMFSYARAKADQRFIITQFGVSAPHSQRDLTSAAAGATLVRDHRLRQCWGEQRPPVNQELWIHGHCAENQSLPSVVARCEHLGLENVVIETLAVHKSGDFFGMCKNCISYVFLRILRKHPKWRVFDVRTRKLFKIT